MAMNGFSGAARALPMYVNSFSMSRPAADFLTKWVMPSVDAWAR